MVYKPKNGQVGHFFLASFDNFSVNQKSKWTRSDVDDKELVR